MNQTEGGLWNIPPPPGTESTDGETTVDTHATTSLFKNCLNYSSLDVIESPDSLSESIRTKNNDVRRHKHGRSKSPSRHRRRNEDTSRDCGRRHKHKKRSRSRSHDQQKRSRLHEHRRQQSSRSRSHSYNRSSSRRRHHNEKRYKHSSSKRPRSKSRSRSKSRKYFRHNPHRSHSSRSSHSHDSEYNRNVTGDRQQSGDEDDDEDTPTKENMFKNDGSFLEMFKKMQEEQKVAEAAKKTNDAEVLDKPFIPPAFGKRRGGRVLKTGMVQKTRTVTESDFTDPKDAWSVYMKEVKRYKEACCDDDSKTRPLVK
ncbi:pre-mRNA-splicing factor 38B [Agrilus planipennis]|uniref:Pre-mRNA-splicing factor 38B n=1 Tax=Agrilus planipennis TaxID=224129 RepID=A0A1W4WNB8_AGRPL|nr:pre-mRNA-splicing factor 38B [Agrilus planipennis]